jgi:nucleotide-binding universal stress UspA family protein
MVSVDDSELARKALDWAVANLLRPEDELHLVCVALPVPYSVGALALGASCTWSVWRCRCPSRWVPLPWGRAAVGAVRTAAGVPLCVRCMCVYVWCGAMW